MIDISWTSNIFAKHFAGNTVMMQDQPSPTMMQMKIQQTRLQVSKRNTDVQGIEDTNKVTRHIAELSVGQYGYNTVTIALCDHHQYTRSYLINVK